MTAFWPAAADEEGQIPVAALALEQVAGLHNFERQL